MVKYLLFTSSTCAPCKRMKDEIQANNNPLDIQIINIEDDIDLAIENNIMSVPTLVKVDSDTKTNFVGYKTQQEIANL